MDERLEKAYQVANYMATLSAQKRVIKEEFDQKLLHYVSGSTFKITPTLINFTKTVIDLGHTADVAFIDENNLPVLIEDVQEFFDIIIDKYFRSVNDYAVSIAEIKSKRKLVDIVSL
jgi:6-pyruvoyl-tetrahydropterin synthase